MHLNCINCIETEEYTIIITYIRKPIYKEIKIYLCKKEIKFISVRKREKKWYKQVTFILLCSVQGKKRKKLLKVTHFPKAETKRL